MSLVSERLKSYPRVSEISLSCTFCWCSILFLTFIRRWEWLSPLAIYSAITTYRGGANVCIVLGKWVCQTFIYGYIVTKYGCNCLKYIFPKEICIILHSTYVFMFWVWSKIQSNCLPNVTSELLVRSGSESGRFLVWQIFLNGFLFFCKVFLP